MPRRGEVTNVFSQGVLNSLLSERTDLEHYRRGLQIGDNMVVLPEGGAEVRGAFRHRNRLRRRLRRAALTAGQVTLPNGGTAANLIDCDESTTSATSGGVTGAIWIYAQVDLGAVQDIFCADIKGFSCASTGADAVFGVEVSTDNVAWSPLGALVNIRTDPRNRRFSGGGGVATSCRYVRVVVRGGPSIGVITAKELAIWSETTIGSVKRRFGFSFNRDQSYTLIASDRNIDVYRDGVWQVAIQIPHRSDQLGLVTVAQSRDVLLLFHPEVQPHTLFRQGSDTEWDSYAQTFSNVATGGGVTTFGAAQDEIQRIALAGVEPGDAVAFVVGDCYSAAVTKGGDPATFANDIKTALHAMPMISSGMGVTVSDMTLDSATVTLTFAGGNAARVWPKMFVDVVTDDTATAEVETVQDGRASSGTLMSATTGWPRCGVFFQDRLVLGGFLLAPDEVLGSRTSLYFDFDQDPNLEAAAAFQARINSDEQVTILHLFVGRHLQVFTDSSEWYLSSRTLDATQPVNFVQATRQGAKAGIGQVVVGGATLFVDDAGDVVRDFAWVDAEQDYGADSLTLLGSDLVAGIVDLAHRRSAEQNEGALVFMVNGDGSVAVMTFLRSEKVRAMCPWTMAGGAFKAINVDAKRAIDAVVERTVGGVTDDYLVRYDAAALLDNSITFAHAPAASVVTGLDHLEGREVWAIADGHVDGPFTVASGQITLTRAAEAGEVGERIVPRLKPMPFRPRDRAGRERLGPIRVFGAELSLYETTGLTFAANGGPAQDVPLDQFGLAEFDTAPIDNPLTGTIRLDRLFGRSTEGGIVEISQSRPGKLAVRAIKMEAG